MGIGLRPVPTDSIEMENEELGRNPRYMNYASSLPLVSIYKEPELMMPL